MKRRVPRLATDEEAEAFLDSDLSDLDFSQFKSGRLRFDEGSAATRTTSFPPSKADPHSHALNKSTLRPREREGRGTGGERATHLEEGAPSETYRLFEQAMAERKQIICMYHGHRREVCPIVLGHTQGEERALTYQFAGASSSKLPLGGAWRCLTLANVSEIRLLEGSWFSGDNHTQPSGCVEIVDLDVNPDSPYQPKRRLLGIGTAKPGPQRSKGSTAGGPTNA